MDPCHISAYRGGLKQPYNKYCDFDEETANTGMEFGILRLDFGKRPTRYGFMLNCETQMLLLSGSGTVTINKDRYHVSRKTLFLDKGWAFLAPRRTYVCVEPNKGTHIELAVIRAKNLNVFEPVVLAPEKIPSEQRGKGVLGGTMHREVRAIFGDPNAPARPEGSNLVLGEVINFAGKWSSYPPHYHAHSEIYYYRFDRPNGFGFSQCGAPDNPVEVREHDLVKIRYGAAHAQVSAPGYKMWYLWAIRQIPGYRYNGFQYYPEHKWMLKPNPR